MNSHSPSSKESFPDHALANVIADMQFLSEKINAFCVQFQITRPAQCQKRANRPSESDDGANQPTTKEGNQP
jgi:hypothetical protein